MSSTWQTIKDALRGAHHDFTTEELGRALILLAVPMILEMAMESIFAIVDVFFVGHLGPSAVASVGLTESLLAVVYTLAMGLGIGITATVARRTGEKDPDGAAHAAAQGVWLGIGFSLLIGIGGALFAPQLLHLMGAGPDVIATGSTYARTMLGGNVVILLLFVLNAAFRGVGDPVIAMRSLWIGNGINIALNPCLILGLGFFPALGVTGSAVATMIGRGSGVLYQLWVLSRHGSRLEMRRKHISPDLPLMWRMLKLSGSGMFQVFIGTASWIGLVRVIATFGSDAVAAYTIVIRIILFALLPPFGLANAAATLVGQNLGAGKPERAEQAVWRAGFFNAVLLGGVAMVFVAFAATITGWFAKDPIVHALAGPGLITVCLGFPFYAYAMVLSTAFNGAGDTWTPTWLNFLCFWCWEIPLAWTLSHHYGVGPEGAFIAIAVAFSTMTVAALVLFRRGKWKLKQV
jgi:putative MATE family efflux protein